MSFLPVAVYGLEVPAGDILVPANANGVEGHFRITMAAIDPTAAPIADGEGNLPAIPRSTLKLIRLPPNFDEDSEDEDELDDETMQALLNGSDDEDSEDENGGPSDPSKSKAARAAALAKLIAAAQEEEDEEMADAKPRKGKAPATSDDESDEDDDEDDDEEDDEEPEEYVICTLDTERNYQQPIDIHVTEGEQVFFVVKGTHNVFLTGNYVIGPEDSEDEDDCDSCGDEDENDLVNGMDEESEDESEDELDDLANPRITEIESEDEAPKLVDVVKKGKKRVAEENLDDMIKSDDKTKKQKNVKAAEAAKKADKKTVQFAKNLEQGPTGSEKKAAEAAKPAAKAAAKPAAVPSKRVVQGVTVDDRKVGTGRSAKKGDTVAMRYIGKLDNGKVFDANKKGKPFSFKLGKGEVIKGWDIGIAGMAIGGERRLTIPAPLAYGSKALPGIPGNSQLTFDVKLLEIK